MPQVLKPEVRSRIVSAAEQVFAEQRYQGARMADIARRAGLSTGNVYRYFASKDDLFYSVIDEPFVQRFHELLDRRVAALARLPDLKALDAGASEAAEELLRFWIAHRLRVVVLLDRCAGSRYEQVGEAFVERLVAATLTELGSEPLVAFTLDTIFHTSRRALVSILETFESEAEIRAAFEAFWSFQLAGLDGFRRWVNP